jgi:predicted DCC family thiol-disulfide oxidoreductase YuxK
MSGVRVVLVYDGLCRFCTRAVKVVCQLDRTKSIALLDANNVEQVATRFPQVAIERLDREMCAVRDALPYYGYDAFRVALEVTPLGSVAAAIMRFSLVRAVGIPIYRYVAANRRRLGCRL